MSDQEELIYTPQQALAPKLKAIVLLLFILAFGVRMYRITAPPIDYHPARQFMCAAIARGMYMENKTTAPEWERAVAAQNLADELLLEPRVMEGTSVFFYNMLGGERLWVPKAIASLLWLLGGVFVFRIVRGIAPNYCAVASLGVYLFLPFGVIGTRSFQPDPLMICLFLGGLHAFLLVVEKQTAGRVAAAAVLWSLAVFIKPLCLVPIGLICIGLWAWRHSIFGIFTSPVPYIVGACFSIPIAYYALHILGGDSNLDWQANATVQPALLLTKKFWLGTARMVGRMIGLIPLALAIWSAWALPKKPLAKILIRSWWCGYAVYSCIFTYHIHTHDYYHLQLIPLVAVSYAFLVQHLVQERIGFVKQHLVALAAVVVIPVLLQLAVSAPKLKALTKGEASVGKVGFEFVTGLVGVHKKVIMFIHPAFHKRIEARRQLAIKLGEDLNHTTAAIYLGEDGGTDLTYYGKFGGRRWPGATALVNRTLATAQSEEKVSRDVFDLIVEEIGAEYFVITDLGDFAKQTELQRILDDYQVMADDKELRYKIYRLVPARVPVAPSEIPPETMIPQELEGEVAPATSTPAVSPPPAPAPSPAR